MKAQSELLTGVTGTLLTPRVSWELGEAMEGGPGFGEAGFLALEELPEKCGAGWAGQSLPVLRGPSIGLDTGE